MFETVLSLSSDEFRKPVKRFVQRLRMKHSFIQDSTIDTELCFKSLSIFRCNVETKLCTCILSCTTRNNRSIDYLESNRIYTAFDVVDASNAQVLSYGTTCSDITYTTKLARRLQLRLVVITESCFTLWPLDRRYYTCRLKELIKNRITSLLILSDERDDDRSIRFICLGCDQGCAVDFKITSVRIVRVQSNLRNARTK